LRNQVTICDFLLDGFDNGFDVIVYI
jgi:hypothetical protein